MQGGTSGTPRSARVFRYAPALFRAKGRGARFPYQHLIKKIFLSLQSRMTDPECFIPSEEHIFYTTYGR
jgi:hypothetical protein